MRTRLLLLVTALLFSHQGFSDSLWNKTKEATKSAGEAIGDAATKAGDVVTGEKKSPAEARAEIDQMSSNTLAKLFKKAKGSKALYDQSYGYAVFDSRRMSFMITTEFGAGVAVDKKSGKKTYMKMATGGMNIGYGVQFLQFVFMFPDKQSFNQFVTDGWDAGANAGAVAGQDAEGLGIELKNGTRVFELNEKGLSLSATLTGTRYWRDDELNK